MSDGGEAASSTSSADDASVPDPWQNAFVVPEPTPELADVVDSMRALQDLVVGTDPPVDVLVDVRRRLTELAAALEPWRVTEWLAPAGKRPDLPGRGHPLLLPFVIESQTDTELHGSVRFTRFYLGGNGAAHGGTIPLLFDEVLGRFSNAGGRARARTAYLHVNYRAITPIDRTLRVEARFEREEGRKRVMSGRLLDGDQVLADAEGLFVALRPGQA